MGQATPKLHSAAYLSKIMACVSVLTAIAGIIMWAAHALTITQLCTRLLVVTALYLIGAALLRKYIPQLQTRFQSLPPLLQAAPSILVIFWLVAHFVILLAGTRQQGYITAIFPIVPVYLGAYVIGAGAKRRIGDSLHCPHCEYPYDFPNEADAPIRCPECGKGWLGILKKGRKVRSPKLIIFGITFAIIAFIILNPIFYIGALAPRLPTPLLYASSYLLPTNSYTAWDELATRKLNPFWSSLLAKRVIGLRANNPYETSSRWFEQTISSGTIPADLLERYYLEGLDAELIAPDRIHLGDPCSVAFRVNHGSTGSALNTVVMFSGYFVDDNPVPLGRRNETLWMHVLNPGAGQPSTDPLTQIITPTRTGDLKVRCIYWLVYQPSFADQLQWQPDGSPGPLKAAVWSRRFELTKTIRVD